MSTRVRKTSDQVEVATYEWIGPVENMPTIISPGDGTTYQVIDGCFEGPTRFKALLEMIGWRMSDRVRLKAKDDQ
jgi:hypothetical protein